MYPKKVVSKKTKCTTHICSECIGDFDAKNLFVAQVPDRDYTTIYCEKCLNELGITEFRPYHKVSEKKPKIITEKKPKIITEKKTTTKKKPTILKSEKDAKVFFNELSNPSKPNSALILAKRKYTKKIK
jgi:hypothetical protein